MKNVEIATRISKLAKIYLAISFFAWVNALYMLWHRQQLFAEGIVEKSFCNINSHINCDAVALSKYSSILGFPTSALGMIFYILGIFFAVSLYLGTQENPPRIMKARSKGLYLLNILAIAGTCFQAYISFFILNSVCLMCISAYALNAALLISSALLYKTTRANTDSAANIVSDLRSLSSNVWIGLSIVLLIHLLLPSILQNYLGASRFDSNYIRAMKESYQNEPVYNFDVNRSPAYGASANEAKLTFVEFSDFQCPFCARAAATLPSFLLQYKNQIRYVMKFFPLDSSCNPEMKNAMHLYACEAAKAAYCVFKTKGNDVFFQFKASLFEKQSQITSSVIEETALRHGLEKTAYQACVNSSETHEALLQDIHEAQAARVSSTPSLFINGKLFAAGPQPLLLQEIIRLNIK